MSSNLTAPTIFQQGSSELQPVPTSLLVQRKELRQMVKQPLNLRDNLSAVERFVRLLVSLITEGDPKVCENAKRVVFHRNNRALFAQQVQKTVQVMDTRIDDAAGGKPGFQGFFDGLLGVKAKDLNAGQIGNRQSPHGLQVLMRHFQKMGGFLTAAHRGAAPRAANDPRHG